MKQCGACLEYKPLDQFNKRTVSGDGLQSKCKLCQSLYLAANRERARESNKRWREANPIAAHASETRYRLLNREDRNTKRQTYKERNKEIILAAKDKPCMDCDTTYPPIVMDFDHRPGESKLFNVSIGLSRSVEILLAEIAKCDVVCANCHRIRTWTRNQKGSTP